MIETDTGDSLIGCLSRVALKTKGIPPSNQSVNAVLVAPAEDEKMVKTIAITQHNDR